MKVTFALPADVVEGPVSVVGDFNDWDPMATPLRPERDQRVASITLAAGRRYGFRYLGQDGKWFDDDDAHDYQPNEFGGKNAILDLSQAR